MRRIPAYVWGLGLVSALGDGVPAHVTGMREARVRAAGRVRDWDGRWAPFYEVRGVRQAGRLEALVDKAVEQALVSAGLDEQQCRGLSLLVGCSGLELPGHQDHYQDMSAAERAEVKRPAYGHVAQELAQRWNLGGAQYTLNTACSSSANALLYAQRLLAAELAEFVLVVGVEVKSRVSAMGFAALMLLARAAYQPFDAGREGLVLGEASAALLLSSRPPPDGRPAFALRGGASACDPTSPTGSAPPRMARLIDAALADAGLTLADIHAIKAHGTGTPANDLAEGQAMAMLSGPLPPFTSLKPYVGHTLGACGALETALTLAAWDAGFLPATPGFAQPDPQLELSPLTAALALPPQGSLLLNYFGFGGNNTCLVFGA